ncbi:MAG: MFS transporter [Bacteroidales bacterium]|nr:MFS transporter [Bacteroidales bacterium]
MRYSFFRISSTGADNNNAMFLQAMHAMLAGIFFSTLDITAHSLFLVRFDEADMARAFILSGVAGMVLAGIISESGKRIRPETHVILILLSVALTGFLLWILLIMIPGDRIVALTFIAMWPLNGMVMLKSAGMAAVMPEQGRGRIQPGKTRTWMIAGIMAGSFLTALLVKAGMDARHLLLIASVSILMAAAVLITARLKIPAEKVKGGDVPEDYRGWLSPALMLRKNRLFRRISLYTVLSLTAALFIRYLFMAETRLQYPSVEGMVHFLGLFTGCMMIFALILSLFVYPGFLRNFRLRSAVAMPSVIIAGLTLAVLVPLMFSGYDTEKAGFTAFFVLIALSRFFSGALGESAEYPSGDIILQVLDKKERNSAGQAMNGSIKGGGMLFSGLLLTLIGSAGFAGPFYFLLFLLLVVVLWMIAGSWLYTLYRKIILATVEVQESADTGAGSPEAVPCRRNRVSARLEFENDFLDLITGDITSLEKNRNQWYIDRIIDHAEIKKDINFLPALRRIRSDPDIARDVRVRSSDIIKDLELLSSGLGNKVGRLKAMLLLSEDRRPPVSEVLQYLRDKDDDLKVIALGIIKKSGLKELLPDVCEYLENPRIRLQAENTLNSFKGSADQTLRRYYLLSSANPVVASAILRVLARNCTNENVEFLLSLLWTETRAVREAVTESVSACNYQTSPADRAGLVGLLSDIAGIITWNISAGIAIGRLNRRKPAEAMDQENDRWLRFLFSLLSVAYGNRSVSEIEENIREGRPESIGHAREMMEILFDEQIRTRLAVLLDDIPPAARLRTLFRFYPVEIPDHDDLFGTIINRDYNLLGIWLRACLIREVPGVTDDEMAETLIALLFSPEMILRQEAANLLSRSKSGYYRQVRGRIPEEMKNVSDNIISGKISRHELLYDRVIFLKSLLDKLPEEKLISLAEELRFADSLLPESLQEENGYILWECCSRSGHCETSIHFDSLLTDMTLKTDDSFYYILPLNALTDHLIRYPEHSTEIYKLIDEIERRNQ